MGERVFNRDEHSRVWVRGNAMHPEKVWGVLEERGGTRACRHDYTDQDLAFYIDNDGCIECIRVVSIQFEWLKYAWGEILIED